MTRRIEKLTATNGQKIEFVYDDTPTASGGMKDVYFSPNKDYVVGFFRDKQEQDAQERMELICGKYRENMFNQAGGEYLQNLYCWPKAVVKWRGKLGVVSPFYRKCFFFNGKVFSGKDKIGKWFISTKVRELFKKQGAERELGNWMQMLKICIMLARATRRMHAAGLAHSDLGYNNCLIDPLSGQACLIDIDGLVVPGKHPPQVVGTPDFIAPEVLASSKSSNRVLPSRTTDLHALAVLIYQLLLLRHPLRGRRICHPDPEIDEELSMGSKALWIENPTDSSNRTDIDNSEYWEKFWLDTDTLPYTVTGPYLAKLFERAFIDGLHQPNRRPQAQEWEDALVKTVDLLQPCGNKSCEQKWYAFDNTRSPRCPFCGEHYSGKLPVLNLYSGTPDGKFRQDNHRLMVYSGQSLFKWHADRRIAPNEKLSAEDAKRVGYFVLHNGDWYLVNERLPDMKLVSPEKRTIAINDKVKLADGVQILLQNGVGGRLLHIQMVG